jgi:hypothetical protein
MSSLEVAKRSRPGMWQLLQLSSMPMVTEVSWAMITLGCGTIISGFQSSARALAAVANKPTALPMAQ